VHISNRYDFSLPVAQRLSHLTGIKEDFEAVEKICARLVAEKHKRELRPGDDGTAYSDAMFYAGALYAAAVVRFMRTQASGARSGIPAAWIEALPDSLRAVYTHVKDLRDKFIAHPIAPLEDNQVFVYVQEAGEGAGTVTDVNLDSAGVEWRRLSRLRKYFLRKSPERSVQPL